MRVVGLWAAALAVTLAAMSCGTLPNGRGGVRKTSPHKRHSNNP